MRLNRYGNIPKGQVVKAMSNIRAHFDPQQDKARGPKVQGKVRTEYFWVHRGQHIPAGIYKREGKRAIPFLLVVKRPSYRKVCDFFGVAERTATKYIGLEMSRAVSHSIGTAKS